MSEREAPNWAECAATGAVATFTSLCSASLIAAFASVDNPLAAVADRVINGVPGSVKHWAVATFGTRDKLVLGIGIAVLLWLAGALIARWSRHSPYVVPVGIAVFAVIAMLSIRQHRLVAYLAALVGAGAAWLSFALLTPSPRTTQRRGSSDDTTPVARPMVRSRWEAPIDRRSFVARATALSAAGTTLGLIGVGVTRSNDRELRSAATRLPKLRPGTPDGGALIPDDATVDGRVASFVTSNRDFYRIDTSYSPPRVDLESWRLRIKGMVDSPLTLSFDDLLDRHVVERPITLCCVSNEVGGDLIGTARWLGVPLAELLAEVSPHPDATQIAMTSVDGWTCGFPTSIALDGRDGLVVVGMNGEPLPIDHGFPVRVVVPGLYGYVSATKWISDIEFTTQDGFDGYWIPLGWSKNGPVKTQSRIDVPRNAARLDAGPQAVAGVAWAQHRDIAKVEVRIDDGPFVEARLGHDVSADTWRQWIHTWDATPGSHEIAVRATDGTGHVQTEEVAPPAPDGSSGWHTIRVDVG